MNSRLKRLEPLWKFLDEHEVRIEDLLACICVVLEDYEDDKFTHQLEIGEHTYKCTFKKGKAKYPFKVL